MKNKYLLLMFGVMFLFSFASVLAEPPFIQQSDTSVGLVLESGVPETVDLNEDYYIHAHIYNATDGLPVVDNVNVYYHLYNHQINGGEHISKGNLTRYGDSFSRTVDGSLFNETGEYSVLIWANTTDVGGFFKYTFDVVESENTGVFAIDLDSSTNLVIMILLLLLGIGAFIIKRYEITSLIFIITGFFMIMNNINTIASIVVISLGVITAFIGGDD